LIYVVEGSTGEYSDHCEWPFAAYSREEDAQAAAAWLNEKVREFALKAEESVTPEEHRIRYPKRKKAAEQMRQYDPGFKTDYTGTDYTYWPIELYNAFGPKP
jgi:N-acetyl-beta-hexosaminidase